jgi:hypothetical protein
MRNLRVTIIFISLSEPGPNFHRRISTLRDRHKYSTPRLAREKKKNIINICIYYNRYKYKSIEPLLLQPKEEQNSHRNSQSKRRRSIRKASSAILVRL